MLVRNLSSLVKKKSLPTPFVKLFNQTLTPSPVTQMLLILLLWRSHPVTCVYQSSLVVMQVSLTSTILIPQETIPFEHVPAVSSCLLHASYIQDNSPNCCIYPMWLTTYANGRLCLLSLILDSPSMYVTAGGTQCSTFMLTLVCVSRSYVTSLLLMWHERTIAYQTDYWTLWLVNIVWLDLIICLLLVNNLMIVVKPSALGRRYMFTPIAAFLLQFMSFHSLCRHHSFLYVC